MARLGKEILVIDLDTCHVLELSREKYSELVDLQVDGIRYFGFMIDNRVEDHTSFKPFFRPGEKEPYKIVRGKTHFLLKLEIALHQSEDEE